MQISQASQTDERAEEGRDGWDGGMYGQTSGWPWVVCLALWNLQVNALVAPRQKEPQGQREAKKKKKHNKSPGIMRLPVAPWSIAWRAL